MAMYIGNAEPPVDDLLNDHIAVLLMARDGLRPGDVRAFVTAVGRRLRESGERDLVVPGAALPAMMR